MKSLKQLFTFIKAALLVTAFNLICGIWKRISPTTYKRILQKMSYKIGFRIDAEDYVWTYGTWRCFSTWMYHSYLSARYSTATKGEKVPNTNVFTTDGKTKHTILDLVKVGRPLVINFGNCTWPPFVGDLADFVELVKEFQGVADFVIIYIEEAHPNNPGRWNFTNNYSNIKAHETFEDRLAAANILEKNYLPCPIYVDPMSNETCLAYGALPERLYIIFDNIVEYEGELGPDGYHVNEAREWLTNFSKQM